MARYKFTQESGTNFKVNTSDKCDAIEDTNEVRQVLDDLGELLGHTKFDDLYPKDGTTGGTIYLEKSKFNATAAPTVNNDIDEGYKPGSLWVDVTNDKGYVCLDNTDGAAVWTEITGAGTSLPVVDTTGIAKGSVDATKIVRLEVDGLTTGTTRVLTVPDKDMTIADNADLAAKLANIVEDTTPQLGGDLDAQANHIGFTQQTITYNVTTTTVDWGAGNKATVTLTGNVGTMAFTNPAKVSNLLLKIVQDATGSRLVTAWDADVKWVGGVAPTLTTTANAIDVISFYFDGTNYFGVASLAFA